MVAARVGDGALAWLQRGLSWFGSHTLQILRHQAVAHLHAAAQTGRGVGVDEKKGPTSAFASLLSAAQLSLSSDPVTAPTLPHAFSSAMLVAWRLISAARVRLHASPLDSMPLGAVQRRIRALDSQSSHCDALFTTPGTILTTCYLLLTTYYFHIVTLSSPLQELQM